MSEIFKKEVYNAFKKVSPSKIQIEDHEEYRRYREGHYNLFFHKLKFPPELFKGKKIIDFGCGTGEVDMVLAGWGGLVEGFDFNEVSIARANDLKEQLGFSRQNEFSVGDIDTYLN